MKQKVMFSFSQLLTSLKAPLNLIIEIRTSDPTDPTSLRSTGWTVIPIFNQTFEPNYGRWRLPVYQVPTNLAIDVRRISDSVHLNDMQLLMRIGTASDTL